MIDWTKRHPIMAFFVLTFAITWGLGFSCGAVLKRGQFLLAPLVFLATCGPALAGILLTAVADIGPREGRRRSFWIAFGAAWIVSALVFLANYIFLNGAPFSPGLAGFALVCVSPVAFVIAMAFSRLSSVRSYLSSLIRLRGEWRWALLALVLIPGLIALSNAVGRMLGGAQPGAGPRLPESVSAVAGLIAVKFLYQLFFFNATGEEVGWRGFLLPRLQARTSPLLAAVAIALVWVPWHLFLWRAEGAAVTSLSYWLQQTALHLLASLFLVWIYNRARGSILVAGLAHAAANTAMAFLPPQDMRALFLTWTAAAAALIFADKMWRRLPQDHPAVFAPAALDVPRSAPEAPAG